MNDKPLRRMTLRQLLTHSEKCSRDVIENFHSFTTLVSDFRDLSRPVRRRSHYPTMVSLQNALKKLRDSFYEVDVLTEYLHEHLQAIGEHAGREKVNRL